MGRPHHKQTKCRSSQIFTKVCSEERPLLPLPSWLGLWYSNVHSIKELTGYGRPKTEGNYGTTLKTNTREKRRKKNKFPFFDHLDACIFCSFFITLGLHLILSSLHRYTVSLLEAGMMLSTLLHGF